MKTFRVACLGLIAVGALFLLGITQGCSKKGGLVLDNSSFDSAPPELKEKWRSAGGYVASKNYLGAATNLIEIFGKKESLTTEQKDALDQAWMKLGNEAFAAANNGDKAATEAVLKMRETGIGERRGAK
jgi:hypothetical protein